LVYIPKWTSILSMDELPKIKKGKRQIDEEEKIMMENLTIIIGIITAYFMGFIAGMITIYIINKDKIRGS